MLIIVILFALLLPSMAHAQLIHQQEWTGPALPGGGWSFNASPVIDLAPGSPAGGGALRMRCLPGVYSTSVSCGRGEISILSGTELYVGHWIKFSTNFTFNPFSTKIDYMWVASSSVNTGGPVAFTLREQSNGTVLAVDVSIQGNGQLGPNSVTPHTIYAGLSRPFTRGVWRWLEYRVKMNTVACAGGSLACVTPNGEIDVWVDDVLQMSRRDLRWIDVAGNTWRTMLHSAEWGGGGGTILPAGACTICGTGFMWYDHTVIQRTRIGMPGGVPPVQDTTPPTAPTALVAQ